MVKIEEKLGVQFVRGGRGILSVTLQDRQRNLLDAKYNACAQRYAHNRRAAGVMHDACLRFICGTPSRAACHATEEADGTTTRHYD